jgi:DNA mismatch repair protein MutS
VENYSPGMKQYLTIKEDYKDFILFFRMGDFYEIFFEDAVIAAKELEIILTSRSSKKEEDRIPMCGFPYKAVDTYVDILVEKGYKIAICEQVEDPKTAKGIVKREVVQLITPGTIMQGKNLDAKSNNYIATVSEFSDNTFGLSYTDLTTGESQITLVNSDFKDVLSELSSLGIKEVVISSDFTDKYKIELKEILNILISYEEDVSIPLGLEKTVLKLENKNLILTFGRILNYLIRTQKRALDHLQEVLYYEINQYMKLDLYSKRNLELLETNRKQERKGSLLWILDDTVTAMGGRRLKQWLDRPLVSKISIEKRLNMVESLLTQYYERNELRENLKGIYDLERLSGRVAYGNVNAKDLIQLKRSLKNIPDIINLVCEFDNKELLDVVNNIDNCEALYDLLEKSIKENPSISIKEGDIIKDGYNDKLDLYRNAIDNDKDWISELEKKEKEETGIKTLKINYNRAAGYYIEIPKSNLHLLAEGRYERKQTLTNVERFITNDLKEKEQLILEAGEKKVGLEYDLFLEIRTLVSDYIPKLQELSKMVSELDVLQSFAEVSERNHYSKPVISEDRRLLIEGGRHPVIEKVLTVEDYITNDCEMNDERELLLITGPNMSGKSTYMRQVALTSIMAQIGCYVAASNASLPIFDQVFTRIGAADDLVSGQSTFMVEMLETQNALNKATPNSLILLDEIGRGTSTYDGVAIAQAIIEYIHDNIGAKTFFSTHYHELTKLEINLDRLKNVRVRVLEENDKILFVHKVEEGAANKSYGIHVAELAELPNSLIKRAKEILDSLENTNKLIESKVEVKIEAEIPNLNGILSEEKEILDMLRDINLLEMTPIDSMNVLYKLKNLLKNN